MNRIVPLAFWLPARETQNKNGLKARQRIQPGTEPDDPAESCFDELKGQGLPLGIVADLEYHECECQIADGQIIVITTDGICEAANRDGEMFGKDRLREIIRLNADKSARELVSAVLDAFEQFIHPLPQKDDATLVVIKVDS